MKHIRQKLIGIGYIALALIVSKLIGEWGCLAYAVPLGFWLLFSRKLILETELERAVTDRKENPQHTTQ